jgi:hypothetical protein
LPGLPATIDDLVIGVTDVDYPRAVGVQHHTAQRIVVLRVVSPHLR